MTELEQRADRYFTGALGLSLADLLAPIAADRPAGEPLQYDRLYEQIREARREDDPTVPQGTWQCDLKRADWAKASELCATALARRSKDLQLLAWLLEARLHLNGFVAIAPCLILLKGFCDGFWESVHPAEDGGGQERRANLVDWINAKLLPCLRQIPLTAAGGGRDFGWGDWEMAHRLEQARSMAGRRGEAPEGPSVADIGAALTITPSEVLQERVDALALAIVAIDDLQPVLDRRFTGEAPGLTALRALLDDIGNLVGGELAKRGRMVQEHAEAPGDEDEAPICSSLEQAMADRAQAYAYLAAAADFLVRLEPHSPVPYLVRRAIDWGQLNTVELYEELFIRRNGQISIFDLLGLQPEAKGRT